MKKGLVLSVLALSMTFLVPGVSFAEDTDYTWNQKLIRGATNIVTSPLEIPHDMYHESKDKNIIHGLTFGLFKGVSDGITRLGAGVIDTVFFGLKVPDAHNAPLVEPEYFLASYDLKLF